MIPLVVRMSKTKDTEGHEYPQWEIFEGYNIKFGCSSQNPKLHFELENDTSFSLSSEHLVKFITTRTSTTWEDRLENTAFWEKSLEDLTPDALNAFFRARVSEDVTAAISKFTVVDGTNPGLHWILVSISACKPLVWPSNAPSQPISRNTDHV